MNTLKNIQLATNANDNLNTSSIQQVLLQQGLLQREPEAGCSKVVRRSMKLDLGEMEDDFLEGRPTLSPVCKDIHALHPTATGEDIALAIRKLMTSFPSQTPEFWGLLGNRIAELRFSRDRLKYMMHVALDTNQLMNQYRYGRLTIADITSISRPMTTYSFPEAEKNPYDKAYVYCHLDKPNLCEITTIEEAKSSGLRWEPFIRR